VSVEAIFASAGVATNTEAIADITAMVASIANVVVFRFIVTFIVGSYTKDDWERSIFIFS
jgi:hypothetical protein